jgi:hypothetical protein
MAEIKFEILREIAVLSQSKSGWQRELNVVKWNENKPKLDIRDWAPNHSRTGKGITLSREEAAILREVLEDLSLDEVFGDS